MTQKYQTKNHLKVDIKIFTCFLMCLQSDGLSTFVLLEHFLPLSPDGSTIGNSSVDMFLKELFMHHRSNSLYCTITMKAINGLKHFNCALKTECMGFFTKMYFVSHFI